MSFANLTPDNDADLVFRADVVGADGCEGQGIGVARNISKVDEDPEIRTGTISRRLHRRRLHPGSQPDR